ncbi:MAG: hypothetical protein LQ343_003593 [Gyalolechia ehrenbergii]|nr:MAG: hypothetical protein LQ343_003593 [Gyalolechia ehrenbergii]
MFNSGSRGRIRISNIGSSNRPQSKIEPEKNIWSSLLDNVASGKKLAEKNLLVLGGSSELQREFLETLETDSSRRPQDRRRKKPPVANEDTLARLSIYLLSESSPTFAALVKPLLTPKTIPETLVVIILDWAEPWAWARQLRDWIRFLKGIIVTLDDESKIVAEDIMKEWQQRRRGAQYEGGSAATSDTTINVPLGQGEWEEPLGLPICVACHGTEKIEGLEKDHGWREEEFDFALQYLRTVMLKHGSSLIYTSLSVPNSLPPLVHSSLGIHSLLKRQTLKHNVIDRDKVLVPPNWDSWGKIRVLREGFDVEGINSGWSIDTQLPAKPPSSQATDKEANSSSDAASPTTQNTIHPTQRPPSPKVPGSVLPIYESTIPNPYKDRPSTIPPIGTVPLETTAQNMQEFLKSIHEQMYKLAEAEASSSSSHPQSSSTTTTSTSTSASTSISTPTRPTNSSDNSQRVNEHIGPVQFNMGGIQVDADEMVKKLKERGEKKNEYGPGTPEGTKKQNEELAQFFQGLLEKGRKGSPRVASGAGRDGRTGTPGRSGGAGEEGG